MPLREPANDDETPEMLLAEQAEEQALIDEGMSVVPFACIWVLIKGI